MRFVIDGLTDIYLLYLPQVTSIYRDVQGGDGTRAQSWCVLPAEVEPTKQNFHLFITFTNQLDHALTTHLMLSKLFTSARTLLDRSSQASAPELSQPQITAEPANEMVTTRRQSGQHTVDGSDAGQTTPTQAPSSSRKRQIPSSDSEGSDSVENEEGESPATKKQKVLPVRGKDDKELKRSTRVAVEIPVSRVGLDRTSPIDPSRKEPQEEFHTSGSVEAAEVSSSYQSRLEIPDSESDGEDPELGEGVERPADSTIRQKQTKTYTASPSASKAKHKRFGSEESEVMVLSTAVEQKETDDESSDDDAPEVVGAQDALKQAKRKELEAAKAIEE